LSYNTVIGCAGRAVSQGQRPCILIGRAVYRDPRCIFLAGATSSLDANKGVIVEDLSEFNRFRAVVVSHCLSTVCGAARSCTRRRLNVNFIMIAIITSCPKLYSTVVMLSNPSPPLSCLLPVEPVTI
jgi:hypothetical protein